MTRLRTRLGRGITTLALTMAFVVSAHPAGATTPPDQADAIKTYTRDVFVIVGSTLRNPDDTTANSAPLFNDAGVNLGLTWGQWKAGTGTSAMRWVNGTQTRGTLHLRGLVPGGFYSVFYITLGPDSENPKCTGGVERAVQFKSTNMNQSPDRSSFRARADGTADYFASVPKNLLAASQVFVELIFHSDRKTYGALPNKGEFLTWNSATCRSSFGEDAMRQFLFTQKQ
jgi:hypothetical protein